MTVRVTKEFHFEGAHALVDYDGKCREIHGHSYKLFVTVTGKPRNEKNDPKNGMLLDFTDLKKVVNYLVTDKYDHALLLREDAPLAKELKECYGNIISLPFQPTCENLVIHFSDLLINRLPDGITLFSLKLYETATSYVEWFREDNM